MSLETIVSTVCPHDCLGRCLLKAHVRDGVIVRLSSDDAGADDPHHRQLRACARGRAYRQRVYHPDRLLHPLVRVGPRGEGQFRRASWEEALALTAEAIRRIREEHGDEALFVHSGSGNQGLLHGGNLAKLTQSIKGEDGSFTH